MIRKLPASGAVCAVVFSALAIVPNAFSQAADSAKPLPASPATSDEKLTVEDDTIVLSPFTVEAAEDKDSYKAKSTLAGARVRTDLRDVSSSISVITSKFLQDTGATDNQSLLTYTTNTEVGGLYGNYSGLGNTNGLKENSSLLNPNSNNRVRGLASADNTRDYFLSDIPWDGYNVDRVDLQRGANSILFGVGSPAGIVNTQLITPNLRKNEGKVENRIGSFGSVRNSMDVNYVFLKDQLALRVAAVGDDTKFRQHPAYDNKKRVFGALRFDPKLFGDSAHTTIKVNFEHGDVKANRPRDLAPLDQITPYFMPSSRNKYDPSEPGINRQSYDAWQFQFTALTNNGSPANNMGWTTRLDPAATTGIPSLNGSAWNPWMGASMARLGSADPVFWYNYNSGAPFRVQQSNMDTKWAISNTGAIDGTIAGYPFAHQVSIVGFNQYAKNSETRYNTLVSQGATGLTNPFPGAQKNLYKDKSLTDSSIFDFYNKLIDGPNKYEKQGWDAHNVDIAQSFFDNKLSFQFVWDKQSYWSRQAMNMSDTPFISIDNNTNLIDNPVVYGATSNSNVGRAYIGSSGHYGNSEAFSDREDYRLTGVVDIRASDFLSKSWITKLVGRQLLNVVGERNVRKSESRNFVRYATDANWALMNNETTSITQGFRNVDWITYLSPTMSGRTSATGSNVSAITAQQSPYGQVVTRFFDSRWAKSTNPTDPTYVDPNAAWTNPFYVGASTQSENPANYVGWRNTAVNILNADKGDIDQLYTDGSKIKNVLDTKGLTWQGYFWDGLVIPTFGYRKDRIKSYSANAPQDEATGVAGMGYEIEGNATDVSEGISRSWGGVIHAPDFIRKNLPWKSDISLLYNKSENFAAENRVDFQGNRIKNARGNTEEYGIVLSTLDDRISLKVVKYKTKVYDANLGGDPATNALGNNTYWLYLAEAWGVASATTNLIGLTGNDTTGSAWYWDWANQAGLTGYGSFPREAAGAAIDAQELAASKAWVASMQPQSFYDAYGIPVNVGNIQAAAVSGNWSQTWSNYIGGGWQPGVIGAVQAAGAGKIRGMYPTGTIDTVSEGYEIELNARPTDNWNISFNASKTKAYRTNLSAELSAFIEKTHNRLAGDAGLIRTWWAGDTTGTFRANFDNNVYSAYLLQKEGNGLSASEIRPWAFNAISNYNFNRTMLKGVHVGGAYRWQDAAILGYGIKKAPTQFDPNNYAYDLSKPIKGKSEGHLDLWIGYERQLSTKVKWHIQANLRNVGEKVGLTPISVQPDGSPAAQRIQEGMTWQLTNTLSF